MKRNRIADLKIILAIKRNQMGESASVIATEFGISVRTFFRWKQQYAGLDLDGLKRLRRLEQENQRLLNMLARRDQDLQSLRCLIKQNCVGRDLDLGRFSAILGHSVDSCA